LNGDLTVTAIPYVLAIIIKVCSITLDEHSIIGALEDLAVLPRPKNIDFKLDSDQRAVIFNHVSHALLKNTAILTSLTSYVSAVVMVLENRGLRWMPTALAVFTLLEVLVIVIVLPKKAGYFAISSAWGIERGTVLVLLLCIYDVSLVSGYKLNKIN